MFDTWPKNHCAAPFLLFSLSTWICTAHTAQAQSVATPEKDKDKAAEIKTLLKERRDTLQEVVKQVIEMYTQGAIVFVAVAQVENEAFKATLEFAEGSEARLAALKKHYETRKAILRIAEGRFKAGQDNQLGALQAKALVLEAQIELLREESKAKQSK
jgi:outer membrane protein TolC